MKTPLFFSKPALLVLVLAVTSCGNASKKTADADTETAVATEEQMQHEGHAMQSNLGDTMVKDGPEYTSKYICPMHCEGSGNDSEGKCPVCGMTYVLNEDFKESAEHDANDMH